MPLRKLPLRRPCDRCEKYYQPTGKYSKLCDKCRYAYLIQRKRDTALRKAFRRASND
jgi:hypothetical protein